MQRSNVRKERGDTIWYDVPLGSRVVCGTGLLSPVGYAQKARPVLRLLPFLPGEGSAVITGKKYDQKNDAGAENQFSMQLSYHNQLFKSNVESRNFVVWLVVRWGIELDIIQPFSVLILGVIIRL